MSRNVGRRRFVHAGLLPAAAACVGMLSIGGVLTQTGCGPAPVVSPAPPSVSVSATSQLVLGTDGSYTATLNCSVTTVASAYIYGWTVNRSSGVTITQANNLSPSATAVFTAPGTYTFIITVNALGHSPGAAATVVTVPALVANAGADQTVAKNAVATLTATTTAGIGAKTYAWTKVSGVNGAPATPAAAATTVPTGIVGSTTYRVSVTDSATPPVTVTDDVVVTVPPLTMTVAAAATPASLALPSTSTLSCTVAEGTPPFTFSWIQTGGVGPAVLAGASSQSTIARFSAVGDYTFAVTVVDSGPSRQTVTSDPLTVSVTSASLAFTTSPLDNLVGSSGNDTFTGTDTTLQSSDAADGGDGADTLSINLAAALSTTLPTLTSIETINISDMSLIGSYLIASKVSGLTSLNFLAPAGAETVTNLTSIPAIGVSNDASAVTLTFKDDIVSGPADVLTVTLNNVAEGVYDIDDNVSAVSSIETINLVSTGGANTVRIDEGPATINVTGDMPLTLRAPNSATTITASGMTAGGVAVTLGTGIVTFTGSPSDDTVDDAGKYTTGDILNGGLGTDTLMLDDEDAAAIVAQTNVTGFETLYITNGMSDNVITSYWGAITTVVLPEGIDAAKTLSVPTGTTIELNETSTSIGAAVIQVPGTSMADSVTVKIKGAFAMASTTDFSKIETVNVQADANATFTGAVTVNTAGSTRVLNLSGASGKTVTFSAAVTANAINGSALTGALTMSAATVAPLGATITGGSGADVLYGSTSADTITTGNGATNAVYAGAGEDLIMLGTGVDTIHYVSTVDGMEIVQGFTAGASGDIFKTNFGTTTGIASGKLTSTTAAAGAVTMATASYAVFAVTGTLQATISDHTSQAQVLAAISGTSVSFSAASNKGIIILYDGGNAYIYEATAPGGGTNLATGTVTLVATLQGVTAGALVDANFAP